MPDMPPAKPNKPWDARADASTKAAHKTSDRAWMAILRPVRRRPNLDTEPEMVNLLAWYRDYTIDVGDAEVESFVDYCKEHMDTHQQSIETLEKKAD